MLVSFACFTFNAAQAKSTSNHKVKNYDGLLNALFKKDFQAWLLVEFLHNYIHAPFLIMYFKIESINKPKIV